MLLSDSANCTVLRAVVLTQYRHVQTDRQTEGHRQTDGITVASTALAMRALRRAVKKLECGPMPNVMVALPNIGGALSSTPQSLADAHYLIAVQYRSQDEKPVEISWGAPSW